MTYILKILPRAERDAIKIFEYLAKRSPDGALNWWDAFYAASNEVPLNPLRYEVANENQDSEYELRQFLFRTRRGRRYRAIFIVIENEIRILRVRGPGQADLDVDEIPVV